MLASADVDGDGMINYEEFLKVMVSLFCCKDPTCLVVNDTDYNLFYRHLLK